MIEDQQCNSYTVRFCSHLSTVQIKPVSITTLISITHIQVASHNQRDEGCGKRNTCLKNYSETIQHRIGADADTVLGHFC